MNVSNEAADKFAHILGEQAGPVPTKIDAAAGGALFELDRGGNAKAREYVVEILRQLKPLSDGLQSLEDWRQTNLLVGPSSPPNPQRPDAGLPPGFRVVDVVVDPTSDAGDRNGKGRIPIAALSFGNLAYYTANNIAPRWAQYFSGTLDELNQRIGTDPGRIGNAPPDPLVRDAAGNVLGDLSQAPQ